MKDSLKVYLAFSKVADYLDKEELFDAIDNLHPVMHPGAYWGGSYDIRHVDESDAMVVVPPFHNELGATTVKASKGIYTECKRAVNRDIPVYVITEVRGSSTGLGSMVVGKASYVDINDPDDWTHRYGNIHLSHHFNKSLATALANRFHVVRKESKKEGLHVGNPNVQKLAEPPSTKPFDEDTGEYYPKTSEKCYKDKSLIRTAKYLNLI